MNLSTITQVVIDSLPTIIVVLIYKIWMQSKTIALIDKELDTHRELADSYELNRNNEKEVKEYDLQISEIEIIHLKLNSLGFNKAENDEDSFYCYVNKNHILIKFKMIAWNNSWNGLSWIFYKGGQSTDSFPTLLAWIEEDYKKQAERAKLKEEIKNELKAENSL